MILRLVEDPARLVLVVGSTHPPSLDLCHLEVKLNNAMEVVSCILDWNRLREMYRCTWTEVRLPRTASPDLRSSCRDPLDRL